MPFRSYIGGDSEVHVVAPTTSEWPSDIDFIYVAMQKWEEIKAILSTLGVVRAGDGIMPAHVYQRFREDSDFHEAIIFGGEYRTLLATLAAYERREDILRGLRRSDDPQAVMQAFVMAAIDMAGQVPQPNSLEAYTSAISGRAVEVYSVPADYGQLQEHAMEFGEMVVAVPGRRRMGSAPY